MFKTFAVETPPENSNIVMISRFSGGFYVFNGISRTDDLLYWSSLKQSWRLLFSKDELPYVAETLYWIPQKDVLQIPGLKNLREDKPERGKSLVVINCFQEHNSKIYVGFRSRRLKENCQILIWNHDLDSLEKLSHKQSDLREELIHWMYREDFEELLN